jgi:hypothetical protein
MPFKIEVSRKPVAGVSTEPVPEDLAAHLAKLVPEVLKENKDKELTITADNEREAALYAAHSKRWGTQQTPELYIHKLPNRKNMPSNIARLGVQLMADVQPENRPGRRSR